MWLIGVAKEDITLVGQLLGIKLAASEFVAYVQLADLKNIGNGMHLLYEKSVVMSTFILLWICQFFFNWNTVGRYRNLGTLTVQKLVRTRFKSGSWRNIGLFDFCYYGGNDLGIISSFAKSH